jgi:hypothetical protein
MVLDVRVRIAAEELVERPKPVIVAVEYGHILIMVTIVVSVLILVLVLVLWRRQWCVVVVLVAIVKVVFCGHLHSVGLPWA